MHVNLNVNATMAAGNLTGKAENITGTLAACAVAVTSVLDKVLGSAVGKLVKKEAAKFQSALEQQITDRLQGPMAQTRGSLAGLGNISVTGPFLMSLPDSSAA